MPYRMLVSAKVHKDCAGWSVQGACASGCKMLCLGCLCALQGNRRCGCISIPLCKVHLSFCRVPANGCSVEPGKLEAKISGPDRCVPLNA